MKNTVRRALLFLLAGVSCSVSRPVEQDEETDSCEPSSGDCRVDEEVTVSGDVADTAMSSDDAEDANDSSPDSSQPDTLPEWCNEAVDCLQNTWYPLPRATQAVSIRCNLDATDTCPAIDWDSSDPGVTSNFSSAISVYDSLGASHRTDVYFRKNCDEDLAWNYYVTVDGMELTDGTAYANHVVSSGLLRFTTDGYLLSETVVDEPVFNFQTATQGQIIDFDFGESIEDGGTGQYGTTSFAAQSIISHQVQDGYSTQGHWSCVDNTCEPVMGICSNGVDAPCCGDGTCNPADGKNIDTCPVDCNWQCELDAHCIGRPWNNNVNATSTIRIHVNLDASDDPPTLPWDDQDPDFTSNFSTPTTVYDADGAPHNASIYFRKEATANTWRWYGLVDGAELLNGEEGINQPFCAGTLTFDSNGFLQEIDSLTYTAIQFTHSSPQQYITIQFDDELYTGGFGFRTTQYAASSVVRLIEQDGHNGTGHWLCDAAHRCIPHYDACDTPDTPGCCGDGECKTDFGMDEHSCPSACN